MPDELLSVPAGDLLLRRIPESRRPLQAWDRADRLLVDLVENGGEGVTPFEVDASMLIVGDGFGALTCALRRFDPAVCIESAAGRDAMAANLRANGFEPTCAYSVLDLDARAGSQQFDHLVMKAPKSIAELEDALRRVRPHLAEGAIVLLAGMDKHLSDAVESVIEAVIGPAVRARATGRARHFYATRDAREDIGANPWPSSWRAHGLNLVNHGGGFSPNSLDIGTDLLLQTVPDFSSHLPGSTQDWVRAVDLGSGNGIVGLRVATDVVASGRNVEVVAIDDSALAVDATQRSWQENDVGDGARLEVAHSHRMAEVLSAASVDLVVVNPPFHSDTSITDEVAWSMFVDAHRVLVDEGSLVVVGNRHLAYHAKLAKIFGGVEVLNSNKRFVVHLARRKPRAS